MIALPKDEIKALGALGNPNFACTRIAQVLIAGGLYAGGLYEDGAKKAEYEQAVYIHWASNLLNTHGDNWKVESEKIIKELLTKLEKEATNDI